MAKQSAAQALPTQPMRGILSYRLSVLHVLLTRKLAAKSSTQSLTTNQWKVLSVLYFWPPITAVGISEVVVLDKAAISRAIAALVKLELAERRHDAQRNTTVIVITAAGRALFGNIQADMDLMQSQALRDLSPAKQNQLFEMLDQIERSLRFV
jgi:DNA-binding MarR family transcriptional regulator